MKRALGIAVLSLAAANAALAADPTVITCKRYKSKCVSDDCFTIADGLKGKSDKSLPASSTEKVIYTITGDQGSETMIVQGEQDKKYTMGFEYTTVTPQRITLQNRTDNGRVSEQVEIDGVTGFYTHYSLHTDGSMKDIPLGRPFAAYFGWCDNNGNNINPPPAPEPIEPAPEATAPATAAPAPGVAPAAPAPAAAPATAAPVPATAPKPAAPATTR